MKDVKSISIALSRIKHDNVKITRKGGAGLQRDNNLTGKIQREWTLGGQSSNIKSKIKPNDKSMMEMKWRYLVKFRITTHLKS
jgi:hypothetical protein